MRVVKYREGKGSAPATARGNLNELVMLTEAAVAVTNVERWAQQRVAVDALKAAGAGTTIVPIAVRAAAKTRQYETSVVDNFVRLGAQSFALHGSEALWERPVDEGRRGPKRAVDVSLFNATRGEEARIEFGYYTRSKLKKDAKKLSELPVEPGITMTSNFLILWHMCDKECNLKLCTHQVQRTNTDWIAECAAAAVAASAAPYKVEVRLVSSQDLFAPSERAERSLHVGMFEVLTV